MTTYRSDQASALTLPASLQTILDTEYPRFSDAEMARRRAAIEALLKEADCDHLMFCGANRFGSSVQWLTGWPVTTEAVGVLTPGEADAMFVQHVNHAPLAQKMAARAKVVWGGGSSIGAAVEVLERRAAQVGRVAVIGPMTFEQHATLATRFGAVKNLNRAYTRLRQVKSAEEIDWMRIGAVLSDRGMIALRDGMRPGLSERELGDLVERAYVPLGGTTVIHFIGVTAMADPQQSCRRSLPPAAAPRLATSCLLKSAPRSGIIPARCCAALRSARSRRRSIAACTRPPTPHSTRSRPCSRTAPCRGK